MCDMYYCKGRSTADRPNEKKKSASGLWPSFLLSFLPCEPSCDEPKYETINFVQYNTKILYTIPTAQGAYP